MPPPNSPFAKSEPSPEISFMQAASGMGSPFLTNSSRLKIVTAEEAIEAGCPFRILISGSPGSAKTHFGLTFPPPIKIIDTENRYKLILPKFRTCQDCGESFVSTDINSKTKKIAGIKQCPSCNSLNVKIKNVSSILCNSGSLVNEASQLFIKQLEEHYTKTGEYGTLIVDNVSKKWDWDQSEYAKKKYGHDLETKDDRLSPMNDYKFINPKHNEEFRDLILRANCHVVMIATTKDTYDKNDAFKVIGSRPDGQKHNPFAVDWDIFNMQGQIALQDGTIVGNGEFTSYLKKNSLASCSINPIKFLDYKKMLKAREAFLIECGITEEKPISPSVIPPPPPTAPATPEIKK
jgi:hypothetical protein